MVPSNETGAAGDNVEEEEEGWSRGAARESRLRGSRATVYMRTGSVQQFPNKIAEFEKEDGRFRGSRGPTCPRRKQ